jgi:hypothetical protein
MSKYTITDSKFQVENSENVNMFTTTVKRGVQTEENTETLNSALLDFFQQQSAVVKLVILVASVAVSAWLVLK